MLNSLKTLKNPLSKKEYYFKGTIAFLIGEIIALSIGFIVFTGEALTQCSSNRCIVMSCAEYVTEAGGHGESVSRCTEYEDPRYISFREFLMQNIGFGLIVTGLWFGILLWGIMATNVWPQNYINLDRLEIDRNRFPRCAKQDIDYLKRRIREIIEAGISNDLKDILNRMELAYEWEERFERR